MKIHVPGMYILSSMCKTQEEEEQQQQVQVEESSGSDSDGFWL